MPPGVHGELEGMAGVEPAKQLVRRAANRRLPFRHIPRLPVFPGCQPFFDFCGVTLKGKRIAPLERRGGIEPPGRCIRVIFRPSISKEVL